LSAGSISTLSSAGKGVLISPGGGSNPFTMRVDKPPFTDVRVRQAFRLVVDRPGMLKAVFGGHGVIANDIFGSWAPECDHAIPQRKQDLAHARFLLKQAGHSDLRITLVTSPMAQGIVNMATVFAQQAAGAGIKVAINNVPVSTFFGTNYLSWTFAQDFW